LMLSDVNLSDVSLMLSDVNLSDID
jgi:hypothetical protein